MLNPLANFQWLNSSSFLWPHGQFQQHREKRIRIFKHVFFNCFISQHTICMGLVVYSCKPRAQAEAGNGLQDAAFILSTFQFSLHNATRMNFWNTNIFHPQIKLLNGSQTASQSHSSSRPSSSLRLHSAADKLGLHWQYSGSSPANSCSHLAQEHLPPKKPSWLPPALVRAGYSQCSHNPLRHLPQLSPNTIRVLICLPS